MHEPIKIIDVSGLSCPDPIIALQNALRELKKGEIIRLISTDRGSYYDIPTWIRINKHLLINQSEENKKYVFLVKKNN